MIAKRRSVSDEEVFQQAMQRAVSPVEERRTWTGPERFFYDTTTYTGIHRRLRARPKLRFSGNGLLTHIGHAASAFGVHEHIFFSHERSFPKSESLCSN